MKQQEATSAVGVLGHAGFPACLAEKRGLLVAGDAADGHTAERGHAGDLAEHAAAVADFGQHLARNVEQLQQLRVPVRGAEVEEERARSVRDIGGMDAAAGELPE